MRAPARSTIGAKVHEAELKVARTARVWNEIELR